MCIYIWGLQYLYVSPLQSRRSTSTLGTLTGLRLHFVNVTLTMVPVLHQNSPPCICVYCMYKCLCVCLRDCIQSCQCMCVYCMCSIGASYLTMPCSAKPRSTNHNQPSYIHPSHSRPVRLHPSYTHLIRSHNYPILSHISVEVLGWLRRDQKERKNK